MKKIFILFCIIILLIIGIILWWSYEMSPVNATNHQAQTVNIAKGESIHQIASQLQSLGLIRSDMAFLAYVKSWTFHGNIQAGSFSLSASMSTPQIAERLTHGTTEVQVTITEGKRATEIAEILQSKIPSYQPEWKIKLIEQEGYLFPDTYLLPEDATIEQIISIMNDNFEKKYAAASLNKTTTLSKNESVTLASIVEREGKSDNEMAMIASVLENRLKIGMALQADATLQYAVGNMLNWWPTPTANTLQIDSPYNTYKNPGLPPTPISNPGLAALSAVLNPPKTDYLYYFTDGKGVTHFAKTLDEQNANIVKFGE